MPPIVTLTTDFGLSDPWVGIMKGVILGICPEARLVDLSHEVARHDVVGGQLVIEGAVPFFPPRSVHLVVIDPGVGSRRRALLVHAGGQFFVGPDNGLFTFLFGVPGWSAFAIEKASFRLPEVSRTFHGRDVFAPAAAHLARGESPSRFGSPVVDPVRLPLPVARREGDALIGEVIDVDRFGNLLTSISEADLDGLPGEGSVVVEIAGQRPVPLLTAYAEGSVGRPGAIIGSTRRLEVFVREGTACDVLGAGRRAVVLVRRGQSA